MARGERRELDAPAEERPVAGDEQASSRSRTMVAKAASISRLLLALRTAICSPERARRIRRVSQRGLAIACWSGLTSTAIANRLGHQLVQQPQPLRHHLGGEEINAGRIAARPGKAGDQAELDRVVASAEDDRDGRGCRLGRQAPRLKPGVAITATRRRTRSAASCRQALGIGPPPSGTRSVTFWPST